MSLLIYVVFLGVIWLLIVTWPWWLLALPVIGLIVVLKRRTLRQQIITGFKREEVSPEAAKVRLVTMYVLFILGGTSALVCLLAAGTDGVQWWLVPLILTIPALHLCALSSKSSKWPRLQRALSENILELLVIAGVVLLAYTIALWRFHTRALDDQTLERLTEWDKKVQEVHEGFERYKPGLIASLVLLGSVVLFRFIADVWPVLKNASVRMTSSLMAGLKWSGRTATAVAVAASLTFLATGPDGPLRAIGLTLKDAKASYEHFQTAIRSQVDLSMRESLVSKAWETRPANVRATLDQAAQFCEERQKFEEMRKEAKAFYGVESAEAEDFPLSTEIPEVETAVAETPSEPSAAWTPKALRQAAEESGARVTSNKGAGGSENNEAVDEMAQKVLDELSPADKLFDSSPVTALLKEHYPVFGEFLDAISSSVTEAVFKTVRESVVQKVIEKRRTQPDASLAAIVSGQVAVDMVAVPVALASLDSSWSSVNDSRIASYGGELASAEARLEASASAAEQEKTSDAVRSAYESADLMGRIGQETHSIAMSERAEAARSRIDELQELGKRWPPLREASSELSAQLDEIKSRASTGSGSLPGIFVPDWRSPLEAISSVQGYCDEKLEDTVSSATGSWALTATLKAAMGNRYDFYHRQVIQRQELLEKLAEAARLDKQRQEQQAVETYRRQQELERRAEESHRAEERPEIP